MKRIVILSALLLGACAHKAPITIEKPVITYVDRPVACPSAAERERIRALRPQPLRTQSMPDSVVERNGKAEAQLGKYEAEGGYADQVDAALDRCQRQ